MEKPPVPKSVDEYIAAFPPATREALEVVRASLRKAMPEAEEMISYGIAALKLDGYYVVYFSGAKRHIGVYPAPAGDEDFEQAVAPHRSGRGTLRFMLDKPIPTELIERIGRVALLNHAQRAEQRRAARKPKR